MATSSDSKLAQFWESRQNRLYTVIGVLFVLVAIVYTWALMPPSMPPVQKGETEETDIAIAAGKIVEYVRVNRNLPTDLAAVDPESKWLDSWSQPYVFVAGTAGTLRKSFVLRSVGQDSTAETDDDFVYAVRFGIDAYKEYGPESSESRRGK